MWTTNGCQADWMCLLANTREGPPHKNKSLICLPLNLPGIYYYCSHLKREMFFLLYMRLYFSDLFRIELKKVIALSCQLHWQSLVFKI